MSDYDGDIADALEMLADGHDPKTHTSEPTHGDKPCPVCGEMMQIDDEYGVTIDTCPEHGVWLDAGELHRITSELRRGHRKSRREAIRRAKRDGKTAGMLLGGWSLMFD